MPQAINWVGSCNKTTGRGGCHPQAIVIHIMDDDISTVDAWFNTPKGPNNSMPVSAHYGIARSGAVHQYVQEMDTAWHAGRVKGCNWSGLRSDVGPNYYTVGIEHEGKPNVPWTDAIYEASSTLVAVISRRRYIQVDPQHVIHNAYTNSDTLYCTGP